MQKILFLGGAYAQTPILTEAKIRGYFIVTCDNLPDNPGHRLADEYYNVSTTDMSGVLDLAKKIKPDLVVAYATDPAAPVAAYVSEKLGLPGNPFESVRILAEKDMFRTFQKRQGLNVPEFVLLNENDNPDEKLAGLTLPFMIKPADSSGSKGVCKVSELKDVTAAIASAFFFSRNKRIIVEEFIDNELADLHGDGFVVNGKLIFSCLGDHIYNGKSNPYNPIGTLWPSHLPVSIIRKIENEVACLISESGFKNGPVNIEARVNSQGKHYIMEIGPRNGGHFVPQAIQYSTGFDMVKASLDVLLGIKFNIPRGPGNYSAYYAVHSDFDGELIQLSLSDELNPYIKEFHQYVLPGDRVRSFTVANAAIGILLLTFASYEKMEYIITNMNKYIDLKIAG